LNVLDVYNTLAYSPPFLQESSKNGVCCMWPVSILFPQRSPLAYALSDKGVELTPPSTHSSDLPPWPTDNRIKQEHPATVPFKRALYTWLTRLHIVTGFSHSWPGAVGFENQVLKRLKGMFLSPIITPLTMQWMDSGLDKPSVGQNRGSLGDGGVIRRGCAPSFEDLKALKAEGVGTILDFRYLNQALLEKRQAEAKALGLKYHNLPLFPHRPPTLGQMTTILELAERAKTTGEGMYLHCVHGKDRTSMAYALIQRFIFGETNQDTLKSTAFTHHFRPHQFPRSARWIENLVTMPDPRRLAALSHGPIA
jgi:Tyrosine phosphatase family